MTHGRDFAQGTTAPVGSKNEKGNILPVDVCDAHSLSTDLADECLGMLQASYGDAYRGDELNRTRLLDPQTKVFLARASSGQLLGCSYVYLQGRRGATAVDKTWQRNGIGSSLVTASVEAIPNQWAEVKVSNSAQIHLLSAHQFRHVAGVSEWAGLLGPLLRPLVERVWREGDGRLVYDRWSFHAPFSIGRFVVVARGQMSQMIEARAAGAAYASSGVQ